MMAAILNSVMLDSHTAILDRAKLQSWHLESQLGFSYLRWFHFQTHSWLLPRLASAICHKKNFIHSFMTQLDDGSHLEFCHLGLRIWPSWIQSLTLAKIIFSHHWHQKFTQSFWLNLIWLLNCHSFSHKSLMIQPSWILAILNLAILHSAHLSISFQTHSHLPRLVPTICTRTTSFIHSDSTWWWQPSWILPCWIETLASWIQTPCYLLSDSLKKHSHSTLTLTLINSIWLKLFHFHLTWWWWPSWIWPSWIQQSLYLFSNSLTLANIGFHQMHKKNFTHSFLLNLMITAIWNSAILNSATMDSANLHKKKLDSFIFTQLDDCSHPEFCHVGFRHCHLWFRHLVVFSQIHSKTLSLHSDSESN